MHYQATTVGTLRLFRGSTLLGNDSNNPMSDNRMGILQLYEGGGTHMSQSSFTFLDSPGDTNSHTYKLQVQAASAGTATVGRSFRELDQTGFDPRCSSTITLMEVAA